MNTVRTWQTDSSSSRDTLKLAAQIGHKLKGGEVIELISDLGGGKTTFVKGLASGLGSSDNVSSPSFTISNQYRAGSLTLHHFDFYRLNKAGIMKRELAEIIKDNQAIVVIEWVDVVQDILPEKRLSIEITATDETKRRFTFTYPEEYAYLFPNNT